MDASVFRNNRLELRHFQQGPNSFVIHAIERSTAGLNTESVELEIPEAHFSDDEMRVVHAALDLLERKGAVVLAEHEAKPEDLTAVINAAAQAKRELEAARAAQAAIEAETLARRLEAEELEKNLATIRAAVEAQAAAPPLAATTS